MNPNEYTTLEHAGFTIRIVQDQDYLTPDEWNDRSIAYLCADHRDFSVDPKGVHEWQGRLTTSKGDLNLTIDKEYHAFLLEAYIHSGVTLRLHDPKVGKYDAWDSSVLGFVLVLKKERETRAQAQKTAQNLIEEWNAALSSDIYGFIMEDPDDNEVTSCYKFYKDPETSDHIETTKVETETTQPEYLKRKREAAKEARAEVNRKNSVLKSANTIPAKKDRDIVVAELKNCWKQ